MVANPEFCLVGEVRVRWAEFVLHLRVGGWALVAVRYVDADWRAKRLALIDAGDDAGGVALFAGCGDVALSGATAVELELNVFDREGQARRAAVDDDADAATVTFAPGGNTEECAKGITHKVQKLGERSSKLEA